MFKTALPLKSLAIAATMATTALAPLVAVQPAQAEKSIFGEANINQAQMAAVAVPLKSGAFNLLVIEQFEGKRACWSESGTNPTIVDPLLLNFVFTSDCRRSTDSNGYSMRIDDEDFGTKYLLQIKRSSDNVRLVATPSDRSQQEILIGQTNGIADDFLKFDLLPGWEFTRRTYQNKPLGHFYFSAEDRSQIAYLGSGSGNVVVTPPVDNTTDDDVAAASFTDISRDIYRLEIEEAVSAGFIAGFEDNTFRPTASLTREQLVSMAIESLAAIPNSNIVVSTQNAASFPDVAVDRWSAAKIAWAQQNNIVSGYKDGTFRPTQQVTRAELMAILRRTAEYAHQLQGKSTALTAKNNVFSFVDIEGHWSEDLTTQMSAYCEVATPFQELGDRFLPDTPAQRNYAAAATNRMLKCAKG